MNVTEYIKAERDPPCSIAKIERTGEIFATFRTSTGLKIDEKILQGLITGTSVTAEGFENDLLILEMGIVELQWAYDRCPRKEQRSVQICRSFTR